MWISFKTKPTFILLRLDSCLRGSRELYLLPITTRKHTHMHVLLCKWPVSTIKDMQFMLCDVIFDLALCLPHCHLYVTILISLLVQWGEYYNKIIMLMYNDLVVLSNDELAIEVYLSDWFRLFRTFEVRQSSTTVFQNKPSPRPSASEQATTCMYIQKHEII